MLRVKLEKELQLKAQHIEIIEKKLANDSFVANAPESVVAAERARLKEAQAAYEELQAALIQIRQA